MLLSIPNILHESVPVGNDENDNKVVRVWGEKPVFDFQPKAHYDIGTDLDILDFERGVKLAGARFYVYRNLAAKLVLSGVEGSTQSLKIGKLALELDAKAGEATAKGRLESPVAADLAAQTLALENLAGKVDIASPQMPMKQLSLPISGKLRTDLARQSAALELGTRFDESKIAVKLNIAKFAPLALGFACLCCR